MSGLAKQHSQVPDPDAQAAAQDIPLREVRRNGSLGTARSVPVARLDRSDRPLVVLAALAALAAVVWMQARPTREWLIDFGIGDAVAYLRVAWNVARGAGATYDGLQPTSGFHPLWLVLHVPLMLGAKAPWDRLDVARLLWTLSGLAAAATWGRVLERATGSTLAGCATAVLFAASGWSLYTLYQGLETPLALLLVALALLDVRRLSRTGTAADGARVGLLLGLGVLARLDAVFVLVPLGVLAFARLGGRGRAALIATGIATIAPPLGWNLARFGALMPVSGMVKQQSGISLAPLLAWSESFGRLAAKAHVPLGGPLVLMVLLAAVLLGPWLAVRTRLLAKAEPLLLLFPAALLHWLYYALRMREFNVPWHLYLQVAAAFAALGLLVAAIERRFATTRVRRLAVLAGLIAVVFASDSVYVRIKAVRRPEVTAALQAGDWLARTLPEGSTYLMYDSWFAALRTPGLHPVDMSGLVGDVAMVPLARERRYDDMVARFHPQVVVLQVSGPCARVQPGVRWISDTMSSREPFRMAAVPAPAFVRAWQALPNADRQESWLAALHDAAVCRAPAAP